MAAEEAFFILSAVKRRDQLPDEIPRVVCSPDVVPIQTIVGYSVGRY